jgi:endonuclease YncB( thermonuclease family)
VNWLFSFEVNPMPAPPLGLTARAQVTHIHDGDTIKVNLVLPVWVRFMDCWAPEVRGPEREQGLLVKEQLEKMLPVGSLVHVHMPTAKAEALSDVLTFGRVVGEV